MSDHAIYGQDDILPCSSLPLAILDIKAIVGKRVHTSRGEYDDDNVAHTLHEPD